MSQETAMPAEKAAEPVKPIVYGYLRLAEVPADEDGVLAELEVGLMAWCERKCWHLAAIFRDIGVPPDPHRLHGLTGCLGFARTTYSAVVTGVICPAWERRPKALRSCIRRTGVTLLARE